MQTTYRPLTARQRANLRGYVAWSTSVLRVAAFVIIALLVAGFLRSFVGHTKPGAHCLWWVVPALLVMGFLLYRSKRWTGGPEFREKVKADLAQSEVAVHRLDIVDAIEVEEREDEGPSYFVKTADGQVVVLTGQYLDGYKRRRFPWKSFEIVEAPASKVFFGLKRLDVPVTPSFVRQPFTWEEFRQFRCKKYKVIETDFESLKIKPAQLGSATNGSQPIRSKSNGRSSGPGVSH